MRRYASQQSLTFASTKTENNMRADKWFISNLDDTQRSIVVSDINRDIIVQGAAGSGKTNLAIHRAKQASLFSKNYAIVIYTIALKRMVSTGMKALGLDDERIAYDWAWQHSGFQLNGTVFRRQSAPNILYLVNNDKVKKFERVVGCHSIIDAQSKNPGSLIVGLDFGDWVSSELYCTYGRRSSIFIERPFKGELNLEELEPLSSAILFKKAEEKIDYLIIDEVQDFSTTELKDKYLSRVTKTFALFGDSAQMIYKGQGSSMDEIREKLKGDPYFLKYNYRLPKSIAKVAQDIPIESTTDLLTFNMKDRGNSDYPYYPKPVLTKYESSTAELEGIVSRIQNEDLDDVAILVPTEQDVKTVFNFLKEKGINSQVLFRTSKTVPFRTINTLDMVNNELPCILTYHAAKGTEFDNVFVPFANFGNLPDRKAFYVACTRSSHNLYISYSGKLTNYLDKVNREYIDVVDATTKIELPF